MTRGPRAARQEQRSEEVGDWNTLRRYFKLLVLGRVLLCLIGAVFVVEVSFVDRNPAQEDSRMWSVEGEGGVGTTSLAVSPTGSLIATTDTTGRVSLLNEAIRWPREKLADFPGHATSVAFTPDGRFLAIGGIGFGVGLWDREREGNERFEFLPFQPVGENPKAMAFSPDGRRLATSSGANSQVVVWDRAERRAKLILSSHSPIFSLAFSPDGRYLAAGEMGDRASIYVWDLVTGRDRLVLDGSKGHVVAVAFSPDGAMLTTAAMYEMGIRLWDMSSGRLRRLIPGHSSGTNSVAFSPDGTTLASAGNDGMVRLWRTSTGDQTAELDGGTSRLNHVAFTSNGRILVATASGDDAVRFWELPASLVRVSSPLEMCLHSLCDRLPYLEKALPRVVFHRLEPLGYGPHIELSGPQRPG
jgi:WD40 repeat protein